MLVEARGQRAVVGHGGVDRVQDCLLERRFVQRGGMLTVFLSVIQTAAAAPHGALLAVLCPHHAAVGRAALAAEQQTAEGVFPAVAAKTAGCWPCRPAWTAERPT